MIYFDSILVSNTVFRKHVAEYITKRDGGIPSDWRNVMLSAGASEAIRCVLKLMTAPGITCQQVD